MQVDQLLLGEQRLLDERAEGAHDNGLARSARALQVLRAGARGARGGDQLTRARLVYALGLLDGDAEPPRALRDRRRVDLHAASPPAVGARDHPRRTAFGPRL